MSSLNRVMLIGNLGKNPEVLKRTEQGDFVRMFIATTRKFRDKNGEICRDTQWHTVFLNNKLGKTASQYLSKGSKVFVSGELRTSEWKDKEGETHYSTMIYASEMKFLSVKTQDGKAPEDIEEEVPSGISSAGSEKK